MDHKLSIELDRETVGSIVRKQLGPVIENELAQINIDEKIRAALTTAPVESSESHMMRMAYGYGRPTSSMLDEMINSAIKTEAKLFIERAMRSNRAFIEQAFTEMMRSSEQKLTRAFSKAMFSALDDADWGFDLEIKVATKTSERDDD